MSTEQSRLRITFGKDGPLKYTSHLDLMRGWERALRRAEMPVAYSGGYNPRPKLQLAAALPLGHSGKAEWLDVWLEQMMPLEPFARALRPVLPLGLTIGQVRLVPLDEPALQTQVTSATYRVAVDWDEPAEQTKKRVETLLRADGLEHERRGRRYDLRPLIEALRVEEQTTRDLVLWMRLAARAGATGRPEAVLDVLGMGDAHARYCRLRLIHTPQTAQHQKPRG